MVIWRLEKTYLNLTTTLGKILNLLQLEFEGIKLPLIPHVHSRLRSSRTNILSLTSNAIRALAVTSKPSIPYVFPSMFSGLVRLGWLSKLWV